jgi:hypothetical protein
MTFDQTDALQRLTRHGASTIDALDESSVIIVDKKDSST